MVPERRNFASRGGRRIINYNRLSSSPISLEQIQANLHPPERRHGRSELCKFFHRAFAFPRLACASSGQIARHCCRYRIVHSSTSKFFRALRENAGDQSTEASASLTTEFCTAIVSLRKKSALLELFLSLKEKKKGWNTCRYRRYDLAYILVIYRSLSLRKKKGNKKRDSFREERTALGQHRVARIFCIHAILLARECIFSFRLA